MNAWSYSIHGMRIIASFSPVSVSSRRARFLHNIEFNLSPGLLPWVLTAAGKCPRVGRNSRIIKRSIMKQRLELDARAHEKLGDLR